MPPPHRPGVVPIYGHLLYCPSYPLLSAAYLLPLRLALALALALRRSTSIATALLVNCPCPGAIYPLRSVAWCRPWAAATRAGVM